MFVDITHNKIVRDTASASFVKSVEVGLVPMLEQLYGEALVGIQMYEDYIADGFKSGGEWYYPLTLVLQSGHKTLWIKWQLTRNRFEDGVPYAYTGEELITFSVADSVPQEFEDKLAGRRRYFEGGVIPVVIDFDAAPTFLCGKYSQSFVDELAEGITREIFSSQAIESLGSSDIELRLVFAPETFMEHTSENVTYRRLLLTDKGCTPRDFWVKWTRTDGALAYTVSDTPVPDSIVFEIGEDVPRKVREKEYRYLVRTDADKYHNAMAKKNVNDWREIFKRAIRRGDLARTDETEYSLSDGDAEMRRQVGEILGIKTPETKPETVSYANDTDDELVRLAREAVMAGYSSESDETYAPIADEPLADSIAEPEIIDEPVVSIFSLAELEEQSAGTPEEIVAEDEPVEVKLETDLGDTEESLADTKISEEEMRREIEAKIRLEYESRARRLAEEEAERLRREQELLRAENERLMEKARLEAEAKQAEEARLRAEIEAKLRQEAREKERLAEAAMLAMEEKKRLEAERAEAERARREEAARLEAERRRLEQAERIEAARKAEAERIRREQEEARAERESAERIAKTLEEQGAPKYISRTVDLLFRRMVDPNVTKRIYDIVKATIEFYHKEDVYIRIKASVPDSTTVKLHFLEVPEEEGELIVNIIKALGKSDLGIAKAVLD